MTKVVESNQTNKQLYYTLKYFQSNIKVSIVGSPGFTHNMNADQWNELNECRVMKMSQARVTKVERCLVARNPDFVASTHLLYTI